MVIHHVHRRLAAAASLTVLAAVPACGGKAAQPAAQSTPSQTNVVPAKQPVPPVMAPAPGSSSGSNPGTTRWTELKAGQCLAAPPPTDPAVVMVELVDCAKPHSAEVYLRMPIPVDAAVTGTAEAECESGLAQYTANSSANGQYVTTYMIDSDQDRTSNNPLPSTLICLLEGPQGQPLTGSAHR